jgi:hypothetical protein
MQHPRQLRRNEIHFDFMIAGTLLSLVSGVSALTYPKSWKSGKKFKTLLESHYPWNEEPLSGTRGHSGTKIIYDTFRNPLAHELGIKEGDTTVVFKRIYQPSPQGRRGYHLRELAAIEQSPTRPPWSATLTEKPDKVVLLLDGLYWGCRRMIESVSRDQDAMQRAEAFLSAAKHW